MIIYKWTNTVNGKIYIGQTVKHINYRTRMHINSANFGTNFPLHCAIRKYGREAFMIEVICLCSSLEELNFKEKEFIIALDCKAPKGYNLKDGGDSYQWHPDMKKNASVSAKARIAKDNGAQMRAALAKGRELLKGKAPWNKGLKTTEEVKAKLSAAHLGQKAWNKGITTSSEIREKQKQAAQKRARPVICVETNQEWPSIEECSRLVLISTTHIKRLIQSGKKSSSGLSFQYKMENK